MKLTDKEQKRLIRAIDCVVNYSIWEEEPHWAANGKPRNHIVHSLRALAKISKKLKQSS